MPFRSPLCPKEFGCLATLGDETHGTESSEHQRVGLGPRR